MKKELRKFGITDLSALKFVTDRGANLVKAMKNYTSYFCFVHRLNNILVLGFYQNVSVKGQDGASGSFDVIHSSSETLDNVSDVDDDGDIGDIVFADPAKTKINDLPDCAREFLKVLNNSKEIVRYVKLVRQRDEKQLPIFLYCRMD